MRAGSLRHHVTIEHRTQQGDDYDDVPDNWETHHQAHAEIKPLSGRSLEQARHIAEHVDHKIRVRWSEAIGGVTRKMRVRYGDRLFNIKAVLNVDERDRMVDIYATEVRAGG